MNKKSTNNKLKTYYYYVCNTYRKNQHKFVQSTQ